MRINVGTRIIVGHYECLIETVREKNAIPFVKNIIIQKGALD